MDEDKLYEKAEKRVDEKIGFYRHLYSYITVNIILIVVNRLTNPDSFWFLCITIFWGIGLVSHYAKVFLFSGEYKENLIEKEMEEMRKK